MKVDYNALEVYVNELKNELKHISDSINDIESSYSKLCRESTWSSPTKDFYKSKMKNVENNCVNNFNKQNNVNKYLENIIENYREAETKMKAEMANAFDGFGG